MSLLSLLFVYSVLLSQSRWKTSCITRSRCKQAKAEKRKREEEEKQRERAQQQAEKEERARKRKRQHVLLSKRTKGGQPVMKHTMQHLLEKIKAQT